MNVKNTIYKRKVLLKTNILSLCLNREYLKLYLNKIF